MSDTIKNSVGSGGIGGRDFKTLVAQRAARLLGVTRYVVERDSHADVLTRPLLGELLSQSIQVEELLDAYDAGNNCQWCWFRSLTAALKLFSDAGYELLHIEHALPAYRLLPIEDDFVKATKHVLGFTADIITRASNQILNRAEQLGLTTQSNGFGKEQYDESLPGGRLQRDCRSIKVETAAETVTLLATAFLNLAADSEDIRGAGRGKPDSYDRYLAGPVSEDNLRSLELRFHNLQSLYDTKVSGTEIAEFDADLPVLRGHISVVFHLLKTATLFVHHYERHLNRRPCESESRREPLVNRDALLAALMNYSIRHISLYIACAEHLCQKMLRRYAEVGEVEVPVPAYRGFHVRPSTLISKLVLHYGSGMQMQMGDEEYDASSALELFRANEKINAEKRRWLAEAIDQLKVSENCLGDDNDMHSIVYNAVMALAESGKVMLYQQPLNIPDDPIQTMGTLLDKVAAEIMRLLTLGRIDVTTDLMVRFVGDKRVLADIELLAGTGYGEDRFGNNTSLPEKLSYLRR